MATVLIVDDDKFTRTVLETIFQQERAFADVRVLSATDGEAGLEAFREHRPDVVILDLLMPKVDGFELCQRIRADPAAVDVELVVTSGVYRDVAVSQRIRNEYRGVFFAKPYQLKEMTRHVAALVQALDDGGAGTDRESDRATAEVEAIPPDVVASSPKPEPTPKARPVPAPKRRATPPPIPSPRIRRETPSPLATQVSTGELAMRPLPAVLFDLLEARATGQLTLRRGRISKTIDLVVGHPVSAVSSVRDETLGHFLVASGVISDELHRRAVGRAAAGGERIGQALIAMGALTHDQLLAQLGAQTRHKVVQSLRWPDGAWRFQPHSDLGAQTTLDMTAVVLAGLRATASVTEIPERVAMLQNEPLELSERGKRLLPAVGQHLSHRFASAWRDGITAKELHEAGVDRLDIVRTLDALVACEALVAKLPAAGPGLDAGRTEGSALSVRDLSEHSEVRRLPQPPPEDADSSDELYSMLFEDGSQVAPLPTEGGAPLEVDEDGIPELLDAHADSGYIDVQSIRRAGSEPAAPRNDSENDAARRDLLSEYLRIQGLDFYQILDVDSHAGAAEISAALVEKRSRFSMEFFSRFELGRDYAKLEAVHAAYERARATLLDDARRRTYDRDLAGGEPIETAPSLEAEVAFRAGEEKLERGEYEAALLELTTAVEEAPNEADYHATLGWALYLAGGRTGGAADEARPHLTQALAINPDHAKAHEHIGIISLDLGSDDAEAIDHLERALAADPTRMEALVALEKLHTHHGQARPLERQYRRLIYRAGGADPRAEVTLWVKLAELYRTQLDDFESARIAYESAAKLAPDDTAIQAALADLASGTADRFFERCEVLRAHWRRDPSSPGPGHELMRASLQAHRHDAAFLAASALVTRHIADDEATRIYERYRPRFVVRAQRQLGPTLWNRLRHHDDSLEIGALFELIAPAVQAAFPLTLSDLEVDDSMAVADDELPLAFVKMRDYVAHMLGVPIPPVYVRTDFGHQVHVGAVAEPVLLVGDDALAVPERSELSFRLGRAMTYLWPGRAVGGSRPARSLKASVLAVFGLAVPHARAPDPGATEAALRDALAVLPDADLEAAKRVVLRLVGRSTSLNLSAWSRALGRTADRVGLLLCGDLPAAVRFAADSGSDRAHVELVDFALSAPFATLRAAVGLSIDV